MRKLLLLLLLGIIFLASCTSGPAFRRGGSSFTDVNYFTGKEGLHISFLEQAPPAEVFEGAPLDVQLLVENKGAFDIVGNYTATFQLTFDSLEMLKQTGNSQENIEPEVALLQIHGKSPSYPEGETRYVFSEDNPGHPSTLSFNAKSIVANFEKNTATFYATACYPYKTYFSDDVCIDTDPQNIDHRKKVCSAEDKSYSKGQGAPLAITAVETNMVPKGTYVLPQFVIHIKHYGDGIVSNFNLDDTACGKVLAEDVNTFQIDARLGNDSLVCYPEIVQFRDGEAETVCKLESNSIDLASSNYLAPLAIELSYQYTETIAKDLVVKRTRPLNLFEETAVNKNFCHAWEEFIPGTGNNKGSCVSKCKAYADKRNAQAFRDIATTDPENNPQSYDWPILQQGISSQELETAWNSMNCVYGTETLCRQNPSSCIMARDLCQPGSFCGWPKCFDRNQKPRVESPKISDSFLSWSCKDDDDNPLLDPEQTCGCDTVAYWTLVEKRTLSTLVGENKAPTCENLPDFKYDQHVVEGVYNAIYKTVEFRTPPPQFNPEDSLICLKVVDKQGNEGYASFSGSTLTNYN